MSKRKPTAPYITIALAAGRLAPAQFAAVNKVVQEYRLSTYLTTMQNIRLLDVPENKSAEIKEELIGAGVAIKGPGQFPMPRVCAGRPYCNLARPEPTVGGNTQTVGTDQCQAEIQDRDRRLFGQLFRGCLS
jgi:sulfite reductase beta subunit-like hemoprotein